MPNLVGLHIKISHPDPGEDDVKVYFTDGVWHSGDVMVAATDITYVDDENTYNLRISEIKRLGYFPMGPVQSIGGSFGILRSKPGTPAKDFFTVDPLLHSDDTIFNALDFEIYDDDDNVVYEAGELYMQSGYAMRAWIFQEEMTVTPLLNGHWELVTYDAEWSVGPWNIQETADFKAGEFPQPPVDGQRWRNALTAIQDTPAAWLTSFSISATFRDIIYTFFNVFFAPNAFISDNFPGPLTGFVGAPLDGDPYIVAAELVLVQSIGGYNYDCGTVTWTLEWVFVADE